MASTLSGAIRTRMIAGTFAFPTADTSALPRIILGERLAGKLRVGLGDTVVIFGPNGIPGPDNPPSIEQFVLSGIYRTGMAEYDDIYTYTSLDRAQKLNPHEPAPANFRKLLGSLSELQGYKA